MAGNVDINFDKVLSKKVRTNKENKAFPLSTTFIFLIETLIARTNLVNDPFSVWAREWEWEWVRAGESHSVFVFVWAVVEVMLRY